MAKQQTFCYTISEELKNEMVEYFKYKKRDKTPPYAIFQADEDGTVITLYESLKVVFQGISADIDASMCRQREKALTGKDVIENKKKEKKETKPDNTDYYFINSIGSDEVGTGDYFGPIVITASYVNKKDIPYLEELGVKDSKKLDDAKIIKIAKPIMDRIPHETIILSASEYNKIYSQGMNMNAIKAVLHNKALFKLINSNNYNYDMIVVDQFEAPKNYYNHLEKSKYIVKNISFTPKAEDKCLSVACSSIISRYIFLNEINKMTKELGILVPLGASFVADDAAKRVIAKYGSDKLKEVVKLNFKNTQKIQS